MSDHANVSTVIRQCLKEHGRDVLEDRALCDVRDGLKPSQRRILWALHCMGKGSKAIPAKCAQVVGRVIGEFHPHGDQACYDTLVNLYWQRYRLVDKQGNFGNPNSLMDLGYASSRYTETRLSEFAERVLDDVDIVPKVKSFTEEHDEPPVLLARAPLILVNGSSGIAMGLSANIPPHNLKEVLEAALLVLGNPECTTKDLLKVLKGPDYGGGVLLSSKEDLLHLYETGKGRLSFTCDYTFEESTRGTQRLVITSLAPEFHKNKFVEVTKALAEQKLLVAPANDEGSMENGTRIVVEFTDAKIIRDRVLPLLKTSDSYQFYTLAGPARQPQLLSLKVLLQKFLEFRRKVERAVLQDELEKTLEKEQVERAKLAAMDNLKTVISILELAETAEDAVSLLRSQLEITLPQAEVILGLQLRTLMKRTNRPDLLRKIEQHVQLRARIQQDLQQIDAVVLRRLTELLKYSDKRGTKLRGGDKEVVDVADTLYYVGVTAQAKIDSTDQPPIKSKAAWGYVDLITTPGKFVVVGQENVGQVVSLSYLDKFDPKVGLIVGAASENHALTVAVSRQGRYVAFTTEQRRARFPVFRDLGEDALVAAVGISPGDSVAVFFTDGGEVETIESPEPTRPNVVAKAVVKRSRRERTVLGVLPLRAQEFVVTREGLVVKRLGDFSFDQLLVAGQQNLVALEDGRRTLWTAGELTAAGRSGQLETVKLKAVIPLPSSKDA